MNALRLIKIAIAVPGALLVVSGCYTPRQAMDTRPRFREGAYANVVLEFYKWDDFFIIRPDYRENGYRRAVHCDELGNAFHTLHVRRDMAVVVMSWNYDSNESARDIENWKSILRSHGFRRVVCLRANENNKLDGKVIMDDWKQSVEQPTRTVRL